jgi:hypothetical protein
MRFRASLPILALALAACGDETIEKKVLAPSSTPVTVELTSESLSSGVSTVCAANVKARDEMRAAQGTKSRASQTDELTALDAMIDDTCN